MSKYPLRVRLSDINMKITRKWDFPSYTNITDISITFIGSDILYPTGTSILIQSNNQAY